MAKDHDTATRHCRVGGTGKTTAEKLIPALCAHGIRQGLIKHTHHDMDVDKPR